MTNKLWKIKAFNFTSFNAAETDLKNAKRQIDEMVERCSVNTVVLTFGALQEHCFSTFIDWKGPHMFEDNQIIQLIEYSRRKGLKVILKPMLNVSDGYWRAYIRFFDEDVPCEPKWEDWFRNYSEYIIHFAELCESQSVDMLIIGCELVGTDHRDQEWRQLIRQTRQVYKGLLTYNCDKYQEHRVNWWDDLDVISSSGYYPLNDWDQQLERISNTVQQYNKPFFFSEIGCPSTENASLVPNDWNVVGVHPFNLEEQNIFFSNMFQKCSKLDWHFGYCIWNWPMNLSLKYQAEMDGNYFVIGKPAQFTVKKNFNK